MTAPPDWQPGDDSLTNLPEPAGTAVAGWRAKGWSDADIWAGLKAAEGAESLMSFHRGGFALSRGPWQRALAELRRREAVNRQHLSDALDVGLTATEADPVETSLPAPNRPERPARARRRKEPLPYAQDSDLDACIAHFAALSSDGKTDTATMWAQGVRWLRNNRRVKVTASALEDRLRSPEHADNRRHRPRSNKL